MTAATIEQGWAGRRWLATIFIVMLGQVALVFWLARHQPEFFPQRDTSPTVLVANDDIMQRLALSNPAQFALANRNGFSGGAWLHTQDLEYDSPEWTEPPRPLALPVQKLASALSEHVNNDLAGTFEAANAPEPQLEPLAPLPELPAQSVLTIEGELATRPLLSAFKLEPVAAPDILSNSVVQIGVNRDGTVFSAILSDGPKDSKEGKAADAVALSLAHSARFQSLPRVDVGGKSPFDDTLQWGRLVFHWRTVPLPATNSTAANQ